MGYSLEIKINSEPLKYADNVGWIDFNDDGSVEIYDNKYGVWYRAEKSEKSWTFKQSTSSGNGIGAIGLERFWLNKDNDKPDCCIYTLYDMFTKMTYDIYFRKDELIAGNVTRVGTVYPPSYGGNYTIQYFLYNSLAECHEKPITINGKEPFNFKPILKGIGKFFFWYLILGSIYILITDPATFFGDIVEQPGIFICFGIFMVFLFRITRKDE